MTQHRHNCGAVVDLHEYYNGWWYVAEFLDVDTRQEITHCPCGRSLYEAQLQDELADLHDAACTPDRGRQTRCDEEEPLPSVTTMDDEAADALEGAARELERLRARERACPTMAEAESRALLRALQECAELLQLPITSSPAQVVDAVLALRSSQRCNVMTPAEDGGAIRRLANFGGHVIREWHNNGERGHVDGGELQEAAEIYGIVYRVQVPAGGCGEYCTCVANGATEGDFCYPLNKDVFDLVYVQATRGASGSVRWLRDS